MKTTYYTLRLPRAPRALRIAIAADLHNNRFDKAIAALQKEAPDMILIPGDLMDDMELKDPSSRGYVFLRLCAKLAPTYYSVGNHEIACYHRGNPWRKPFPVPIDQKVQDQIAKTGAVFLDNDCIHAEGLTICGLSSGIHGENNFPNAQALDRFSKEDGFRILLCHHPEYYRPYIRSTNIDLIISGHAHGGHWRVFGHGIYAPGQGLFPRDTAGILDNRCIISRGLGNHTRIPRIFNEPELILLTVHNR